MTQRYVCVISPALDLLDLSAETRLQIFNELSKQENNGVVPKDHRSPPNVAITPETVCFNNSKHARQGKQARLCVLSQQVEGVSVFFWQ